MYFPQTANFSQNFSCRLNIRFYRHGASLCFPLAGSHTCHLHKVRSYYRETPKPLASHNNLLLVTPFCFTMKYKNKDILCKLENIIVKYLNFSSTEAMKLIRQS
jgi:hypothetical protein